jgi:hypothetical protein
LRCGGLGETDGEIQPISAGMSPPDLGHDVVLRTAGITSRVGSRNNWVRFVKMIPRLVRPIEPRFMATGAAALTPDLRKRRQFFQTHHMIAMTRMVG